MPTLDKQTEEFLKTAWSDHGDHPQTVADRLAGALNRVHATAQLPPFVRLLVHVYGEHLAQWQTGEALLVSLREQLVFEPDEAATQALLSGIATLRYAGGDASALDALAASDRASALATAASASAAQHDTGRAIASYTEALRIADLGLPAGSPVLRELAIAGNNLAITLEQKKDRQSDETSALVVCAQAALIYWKLAGTWLEEERAEYRLARSLLQAGQAVTAIAAAQRCVAVCVAHEAPAFEQFFAYAVLAMAHQAAGQASAYAHNCLLALGHWETLEPEDRPWCRDDLAELGS